MKNNFIPVSDGNKKLNAPIDRIKYVHANGAYATICMLDGKQYYKSWRIGVIDKYVKHSKLFFRSHESALVNILCVNWLEPPLPKTLPMIDGTHQLLAKRNKKTYKEIKAQMTAGITLLEKL